MKVTLKVEQGDLRVETFGVGATLQGAIAQALAAMEAEASRLRSATAIAIERERRQSRFEGSDLPGAVQ
jgi:hypothetical protein